ncbi:hypothetical protein GCM10022206_84480 [Streptomyces chiangmaiensis]
MRRHFGRAFPVEASYEEFTEDIPENRILLTAARRLLALPGVPTACRSELRRVIAALPDVGDVPSTRALPDWTADPHNARLQTAIRLGELVLRGASYELDGGGTVPVDGLLINMEKVFEDFVAVSLRDQHTRTWEACRQGSLLEFRSGEYDKSAVRHLYRGCVSTNEFSGPGAQQRMPQPPSEQHPGPDNPREIHVALPEEPPDVTESVAVALLYLLRALMAAPSRPYPEAGDS